MERFEIAVPEAVLDDLRHRLSTTRWTRDIANDDWKYGANTAYIKELVDFWLNDYDWRERERAMNAFPQYRTVIDGIPIHFIHLKGKGPNPMPLILNHGWPWSFWDYEDLLGPLSDPAAHGGDPADAFDIILPSLPGYGFSSPLEKPGINFWNTADLWVKLMDELGYDRFASQGADFGAMLTTQLGHKFADRLIGIHIQMLVPLNAFSGAFPEREDYEPDNLDQLASNEKFFTEEVGYWMLQTTRPQTPSIGMNDSPAGMLAWFVEKLRSWSDCGGNIESKFTRTNLIDNVMLYWVTETFASAARYYYEAVHVPWAASHDRSPVVETPTGAILFPKESVQGPRKWIERYFNLQHWTEVPTGGHFGPREQPHELLVDLREFFRSLR